MVQTPKIIYFIEDYAPNGSEALEIATLPVKPVIRTTMVDASFEECDGVLGAVPELFDKYPPGHPKAGTKIPNGAAILKKFGELRDKQLKENEQKYKADIEAREAREAAKAKAEAEAKSKTGETGDDKPKQW